MESKTIHLKTGEKLLLREANAEDAEIMIAYVKRVGGETDFLTFKPEEFTKTIDEEIELIIAHKEAPNQLFLLAWIGAELVGMLNIQASHKVRLRHVGEFGISVLKNHWGKGIGASLMTEMIAWAKKNVFLEKISLKTQVENVAAVKMYERFGFEVEGRLKKEFLVDGNYRDTLVMGLWIK